MGIRHQWDDSLINMTIDKWWHQLPKEDILLSVTEQSETDKDNGLSTGVICRNSPSKSRISQINEYSIQYIFMEWGEKKEFLEFITSQFCCMDVSHGQLTD